MLTFREAERAFQLDPPPEPESEGFAAFLHFYEPQLNERVRRFLGKRAFDAETLLEYKLACAAAMLEEAGSFSGLDEYKAVRQMAALMYGSTQGDSQREFIKNAAARKRPRGDF